MYVNFHMNSGTHTHTITAVSSSLLNTLDLYAQWSAAAYCSGNTDGANTAVSCSFGNCPDVQAASTTMLYEFDK